MSDRPQKEASEKADQSTFGIGVVTITLNKERFAGLNIRGFSPMKFFVEILSQFIGHQCLLFTYS